MDDECRVSVVIAAYNAEGVIGTAIDSILGQTRAPLEIIVIDDGSCDGTRAKVESYGDRVLYHYQDNAGVSAARNAGVRRAHGEWVVFLDVDDRYYLGRIEAHCRLLEAHPKVDFVVGNYDFVSPEGEVRSDAMSLTALGCEAKQRCDAEGTPLLLQGEQIGRMVSEYFGHTLSIGIRREVFTKLGGFPEGYRVGEDLQLLIRLCARSHSIGVICEPLGAYVVHDEGLVRSDRVFAQQETVRTLRTLLAEMDWVPAAVREHYRKVLLGARHDWATALLRKGERYAALRAMLPALREVPGWPSVRAVLSVLKG